jgi:hypothetical protein
MTVQSSVNRNRLLDIKPHGGVHSESHHEGIVLGDKDRFAVDERTLDDFE